MELEFIDRRCSGPDGHHSCVSVKGSRNWINHLAQLSGHVDAVRLALQLRVRIKH